MEDNEKNSIEIDLKRLALLLWNYAWLIILVGVICAAVAFSYARFFITPSYSASTQLYVNNNYVDSPGFSSSQLTAAQDLAETYMVILESRSVLDVVAQKSGLGYTYNQLKGMVSASSINETEVFQVNVVCSNYQHAALIANTIAEVLPDRIAAVVEGSSVRVVDYAAENPNPVGPSYRRYVLLGVSIGIFLTVAAVIIFDIIDTTIKSEDFLVQTHGKYPLLAVIPDSEDQPTGYGKGYYRGNYESKQGKASAAKRGGASK